MGNNSIVEGRVRISKTFWWSPRNVAQLLCEYSCPTIDAGGNPETTACVTQVRPGHR